jgi:uncharacterized tellurite resistance protein B-like protein
MIQIFFIFVGLFLILNTREFFGNILGLVVILLSIKSMIESFTDSTKISEENIDGESNLIKIIKNEIKYRTEIEKYAAILASASIHIAKSDGRISEKEIETLRITIHREFADSIDEKLIAKIVQITKDEISNKSLEGIFDSLIQTINLFYYYLQNAGWEARVELTTILFTLIYEVAISDGGITSTEEHLFNRLCFHFSIPGPYLENIKRTAFYNYNTRQNQKYSNYSSSYNETNYNSSKRKASLELFNLKDNFTLQELEKAWKQLAVQYHPDKFHSAKPEIYNLMNKKFVEAKEAYEFLKKEKL